MVSAIHPPVQEKNPELDKKPKANQKVLSKIGWRARSLRYTPTELIRLSMMMRNFISAIPLTPTNFPSPSAPHCSESASF